MAKLRYISTTPKVSQEGYEDEWFSYNLVELEDIPFDDDLPVMLDIETHKKNFSDIRTVQLFQEHWEKPIILDTNKYSVSDIYDKIKHRHLVIHNASFELSCFQTDLHMDKCVFDNFSDTFLLARKALALKIDSFGFDAVAAHIHGVDYYTAYAVELGWKEGDVPHFKKSLQKSFLDSPKSYKRGEDLYYEQLRYGALDVMLMSKMYRELKYVEDEFIIQLDYKFIKWAQRYQRYGLPVDRSKLEEEERKDIQAIEETKELLPEGLNVGSWVQVRKLFDSDASDDTFLASVENDYARHPDSTELEQRATWAKAIRKQRRSLKRLTYIKVYKTDRITGFVAPRTKSGRIAAEELNTLQIPRSLKRCFGYENKDKYMIYADFSNLELRMLTAIINEEKMAEKFMNKEDLHTYSGSQVYEKPPEEVSKAERFIGKFFNFSAGYGAGAARLCAMLMKEAGIYMSEEDMRPMLRKWKNAWPAIKQMHQVNGRSKDNIARTLGGRVVHCDMYTDLNAIPPQGSSAEVFKLAHLYMIKSKPDIIMCNAIHDSYISETELDINEARYNAKVVGYSMITAWFQSIQNSQIPTLPMPTDVVIGHNWQDLEVEAEGTETLSYPGTYEMYLEIKDDVINGNIKKEDLT